MGSQRHRLAARRRRVIFNDDGDTCYWAKNRDELLADRFNTVLNSDVDTYFYCVHTSVDPAVERFDDASRIVLEAAHENDLEAWASVRMNDTHDAHIPKEVFNAVEPGPVDIDWERSGWRGLSDDQKRFFQIWRPHRLKQTHPETMIGEQRMRFNYDLAPLASFMHMTWSAFDFAHPAVRRTLREQIEGYCRATDWDGLEMDFIRMPVFFKPGQIEKNIPTMTGFVGEIRAMLDRIGQQRGRPYPLAVHVPDAPKYCLRCGLDIATWLAEDLVDLVVMGTAYRPHAQRYGAFADLCHSHGVPVYPCFNVSSIAPDNSIEGGHVIERFRGRLSAIWSEDVDGIQLFNLFGSAMSGGESGPLDELDRVGGPEKLVGLDKLYEAGTFGVWTDREILADPPQRPRVVDREPVTFKVGDPLDSVARAGKLAQLRLEVRVSEMLEEESVCIKLNGTPVQITGHREEPRTEPLHVGASVSPPGGWWFVADVDAPPARQGMNVVTVSPGPGSMGKAVSRVENVQLWVGYKRA